MKNFKTVSAYFGKNKKNDVTKRFKKYYGMPPSKYKQKNLVDL